MKTPQPKLNVKSTVFSGLNHICEVCFSCNFPVKNYFEKPHLMSSLLLIPSIAMLGKALANQRVVKKFERALA